MEGRKLMRSRGLVQEMRTNIKFAFVYDKTVIPFNCLLAVLFALSESNRSTVCKMSVYLKTNHNLMQNKKIFRCLRNTNAPTYTELATLAKNNGRKT